MYLPLCPFSFNTFDIWRGYSFMLRHTYDIYMKIRWELYLFYTLSTNEFHCSILIRTDEQDLQCSIM